MPLAPAQDYKRIFAGDQGPNTGGMGSYCPVPGFEQTAIDAAMEKVVEPTLDALRKRGIAYRGVLYAGLIVTDEGLKVLEFNCRFGDPETQAVLPRLRQRPARAVRGGGGRRAGRRRRELEAARLRHRRHGLRPATRPAATRAT